MVIQLTKALTDVSVIATASREESRDWVRSLGADAVVDHFAEDLAQQVLAIAPDGVDYVFTPQSRGRVPLLTTVVRPFGEIVAIDDERDLDLYALKDKAISWHWEFMLARLRPHHPAPHPLHRRRAHRQWKNPWHCVPDAHASQCCPDTGSSPPHRERAHSGEDRRGRRRLSRPNRDRTGLRSPYAVDYPTASR